MAAAEPKSLSSSWEPGRGERAAAPRRTRSSGWEARERAARPWEPLPRPAGPERCTHTILTNTDPWGLACGWPSAAAFLPCSEINLVTNKLITICKFLPHALRHSRCISTTPKLRLLSSPCPCISSRSHVLPDWPGKTHAKVVVPVGFFPL